MEYFCCDCCNDMRPLDALLDLDCHCCICTNCCDERLRPCMTPVQPTPSTAAAEHAVGDIVRYRQRDGKLCLAKVVQVDRSIQPWGYGIELQGNPDIRFTEGNRLLPQQLNSECLQEGFPVVRCPKCSRQLDRQQLARILPDALQQLDEALTNAWLDAKGIIRCPTAGCEALIEKVCSSGSCRSRLSELCTRQLPCGHFCCGVRGTSPCLPCLVEGCSSQASLAGDGNCCFCFEPLPSAAVIALQCQAGHFVHLSCARKRLQVGCPGPALTFDFLFCPMCGSGKEGRCGNIQVTTAQPHLQHSQLQAALDKPLRIRQHVVQLAKQRLKLEGAAKRDRELQPGGKFDGRPVDWALSKYVFFECSKCHLPYFGGARECGAAGDAPAAYDAQELVCGSCSAHAAGNNCPSHGTEFVAWKCKYCCSVASWFCWGSTHMCSRCHDYPSQRHGNRCPGMGRCELTVPHPPPGESACLGCEACRHKDG
ncbi:hypothetical protein OEZ85_007920 [Tetradesmus obliquus]|uniref:RING-type domain-containing protein n=1 Tax=Tetradesmus obliquus TaxID=3088 RepID=A0ABY8THD6_TETOB|nr:hypothetical protein OEZ85_007920 [Tetradesmus obliquus]